MKLQRIFKLNHRHVTKIVRRRRLGFERLDARRVLAAFVVDTLTDGPLAALAGDGHLSLREAIQAANTNASVDGSPRGETNAVDTIRFAANLTGAIKLSAGALVLDGRVELNGPGADRLTIDGDLKSGVLKVSSLATQATIRDLAIARGRVATSNGVGGGIANYGMLIVERVAVSDCIVGFAGGGIYNTGTLTLIASTIANNVADFQGGGIANDGTLNLIESTIALI